MINTSFEIFSRYSQSEINKLDKLAIHKIIKDLHLESKKLIKLFPENSHLISQKLTYNIHSINKKIEKIFNANNEDLIVKNVQQSCREYLDNHMLIFLEMKVKLDKISNKFQMLSDDISEQKWDSDIEKAANNLEKKFHLASEEFKKQESVENFSKLIRVTESWLDFLKESLHENKKLRSLGILVSPPAA